MPEEITRWIIEMFNFHKFTSTNSALTGYAPGSKHQADMMNSELKAILKTMDYFIQFFSAGLPDHTVKTDILTGKALDELMVDLSKDYNERQKYIQEKIIEFAKAAQVKD